MCTNMKWVYNAHINKRLFVPCGHCKACQQEKANKRIARIKNNVRPESGVINLFTTFTYSNDCVPYILRSDLEARKLELTIYRDSITRRRRVSSSYAMANERRIVPYTIIDTIDLSDPNLYDGFAQSQYKSLKNADPNKIGVCYYKDIQNFYKRLRQNLLRVYHYEKPFSFFQCSELGPVTGRPHFHGVLTIPAEDEQLFRSAINASWTFNDFQCSAKKIMVARDVASYVSSYVNRGSHFPKLFKDNAFKPKHSYSKGYGMANIDFSLDKILQKIDKRDLHFNVCSFKDGVPEVSNVLVPQYVLRRYFPKFKGYSRLASSEAYELLQCPEKYFTKCKNNVINDIQYVSSDIHRISVSLRNSLYRFAEKLGLSVIDARHIYPHYFIEAWKVHDLNVLADFYNNSDGLPIHELYDNISILKFHPYKSKQLAKMIEDVPIERLRPNDFEFRKIKTCHLSDLYDKKDKSRKVTNHCMSRNGCYV